MSVADLQTQLRAKLKPVYLVVGDAAPLVQASAKLIETAGLEKCGLPAFNHSVFRGSEGEAVQSISAARTLPMMGALRVVVVREVGQANDVFFEALADYLKDPSDTTLLLLVGERMPKPEKGRPAWASKIPKAIKAAGGEVLKLHSKGIQPERFAADAARRAGKTLGREAAYLLVETIGPNLSQIGSEVGKLALYAGDRDEIVVDDVREVCAVLAEAVIWDLTAGLAAGDRPQTVSALYRLQSSGDEPRRLLAMVTWKLRQLLVMAEMARLGAPDDAIRRSSKMNFDDFRKVRPRLQNGMPAAAKVLTRLARANAQMNSHRAGANRILDVLVLEMLLD